MLHSVYANGVFATNLINCAFLFLFYTPTQRGHYHHGMIRNPTAAVNLFYVGKQYLTFWQAKAAVTRNLIGRKIISNVKPSDTRNSSQCSVCKGGLDWTNNIFKRHTLQSQTHTARQSITNESYVKRQVSVIRAWSAISLSDGI